MSRRKKQTYGCVIAVVAVALALDRVSGGGTSRPVVVRGGPSPTRTRTAQTRAPGTRPGMEARGTMLVPARFPSNLPEDESPVRDVLGLTPHAASVLRSGTPNEWSGETGVPSQGPGTGPAETFAVRHEVSAVVSNRSLEWALVDGSWRRVGDTVDGCTLTRIEGRTVVFDCDGVDRALTVNHEALSDGDRR